MTRLFVTATGTGIGKTLVTCLLRHQARRAGRPLTALKPVISGFLPADAEASDSGQILLAGGEPASLDAIARISPWRFAAPLSPDMAAARENRTIDFEALLSFCRAEMAARPEIVIEGVGGAFSPVTQTHLVADWIAALDMPFVLVVGAYLGTISHTLSCLEALAARGQHPTALILSDGGDAPVEPAETRAALARFRPGQTIHILPRLATLDRAPDLLNALL